MSMPTLLRRSVVVAAAAVAVAAAGAPAPLWAASPPDIGAIPNVTPKDPPPAPPVPMKQSTACAVSAQLANTVTDRPAPASAAFGVASLHQYATGKGVTVAVIDSGVQPNSRLPRLRGGGDYIGSGTGLDDCDHHGTLVAGIIAAQPSTADDFVGVAPGVSLISIRQTSSAYQPVNSKDTGSSTLSSLANAIVRAVNLGAQVVNLSVTACFPQSEIVDTSDLAQAIKWAVQVRNTVIVAAAGNANSEACKANPGYDPANGGDPRNWRGVQTVSMPSFYSPLVISVGGSDLNGGVYSGTLPGPWVDVAAPATDIVSLDPSRPSGGLTNATPDGNGGVQTIAGTSFATAYVSGLAALILEKFPTLTAAQVRSRIVNTAHPVSAMQLNELGYGTVDGLAALTWPGAEVNVQANPASRAAPPTSASPLKQWLPAAVAAIGSGLVLLLALTLVGFSGLNRRLRGPSSQTSSRTPPSTRKGSR